MRQFRYSPAVIEDRNIYKILVDLKLEDHFADTMVADRIILNRIIEKQNVKA
jgi:hypothetical protein